MPTGPLFFMDPCWPPCTVRNGGGNMAPNRCSQGRLAQDLRRSRLLDRACHPLIAVGGDRKRCSWSGPWRTIAQVKRTSLRSEAGLDPFCLGATLMLPRAGVTLQLPGAGLRKEVRLPGHMMASTILARSPLMKRGRNEYALHRISFMRSKMSGGRSLSLRSPPRSRNARHANSWALV